MVDQASNYYVTLSKKELIFLCSLIGAESIIGIDDPFLIYTQEQIDSEFADIKKVLEERNYLKTSDSGDIILDENILAIVNTCIEAQAYILIDKIAEDKSDKIVFYATFFAVIMLTATENDDEIFISFKRTTEDVRNDIYSLIPLIEPGNDEGESSSMDIDIRITESLFDKIIAAEDDSQIKEAVKALEDSGVDKDYAEIVANTLSKPSVKTSFLSLENGGDNELDGKGFAIFEGDQNILLMIPSDEEEYINVCSYKKDKISSVVESILNSILRTYFFQDDDVINFMDQLFLHQD
ncbi:hypothetical protein [Pseudobacteroides cellulosolvens]|uniref:Uncharacterized protein n=1 Tax=Pseudobacteroides cellulosolvens ATCC 35603 = DSM 2933 TaxID=398512 RepID=A0A0L6JP03_9FIRM|nr:hypothetical protein [Pseudobacteroides cellulosolvens]KNY27508.1 hypothetical protein Bccel_2779 [Pseudobacteroides cellulosolvens ATCC 35603 = DSM 2933]